MTKNVQLTEDDLALIREGLREIKEPSHRLSLVSEMRRASVLKDTKKFQYLEERERKIQALFTKLFL